MTDNNNAQPAAPPMDDNFLAGLTMLLQAYTYAQDARADLWDFALEIDVLYQTGITISDLRWLVTKGYAQHGRETSVYGDAHRSFQPSDGLNFSETTCFVLTPSGADFAGKALRASADAD